ncbi:MAG: DUF1858 domain-containing protein [Bacilli bacterium]|nr:DUF1858 domain-containing protein [Bacilli bacterium]
MEKILDLSKCVKDLVTEYPEISEIMKELGFKDITNPVMLNTVGRFMTIPKGAKIKNISLEHIKHTFEQHGFTIKE